MVGWLIEVGFAITRFANHQTILPSNNFIFFIIQFHHPIFSLQLPCLDDTSGRLRFFSKACYGRLIPPSPWCWGSVTHLIASGTSVTAPTVVGRMKDKEGKESMVRTVGM